MKDNMSSKEKKTVSAADFNKKVEMESDWIQRHEYENDKQKAWNLAKYRVSQDYQVG